MIKTTTPQVVNAQTGESAIVFFDITHELIDRMKGIRTFNLVHFIEVEKNGQTTLHPIGENKVIFKEATIQSLYGALTLTQFQNQMDALLIGQIEYINSYEWTGGEAMKPIRYWNLTASDLEIVV